MEIDKSAYSDLFRAVVWPPIRATFELLDTPPHLVANINLVPFVGNQVLILRLSDASWEIPGGTLEPGETYQDCIRRELLEEAGAELLDFHLFGAWKCYSEAVSPYKAHLPHPEFYRVVGYGQVNLLGKPLNPDGGEEVVSVETVTVEEAVRRFRAIGRGDLADLYRLATTLCLKG